ncbi:BppU family phage baseplate upper protein [Enterococcus faecium]|uniref:BppU family phage baseplate upper protein n=1 Tax=Enterococcus faecium TaxID=1352 RepID=UPI001F436A1E|nr:BppU family phage baseplate upper protein [Enterococcus faecium]MDT6599109.1 BppU family phage baseplate upper protein [Enterococcus faecium]MDT6856731.1 BppU family phage baseplate upper protein [Enterococcus faecium]MDT6956029.1 BppU family phage baseplate upper protein [Enterococcus faecium]MDV4446639.1 BppU family phage baseplate upper protein [Enterococcus faecium]MDV4904362.1 BppU family phage baseplate upper protein [Enterococcus faecium]
MAHVIKKGSIKVPTQPKDYDLQATGLVFKSYDNQIALEFNVEQQNGTPADLLGANLRLLMFIYDEVDGMITKEPIPFITKNLITESFLNGQVVYILPEAMKAYNGMVEAYVYIEYPDGSTSDNLGFTFRMKRSAIDGLAQDKADYFIADFQQLLDGVKQEATDAVNEVLAKVEAVSKNVSSAQNDLTILEDRIDQTNQQIGDLGKLKKMYSNSIDFGEYDYSGNPNLSAKLNASSFSLGTGATVADDNDEIVFTLDGTNQLSKYASKAQVPVAEGKQYTISCEIMLEDGFTGDPSGIRLQHAYLPGGVVVLQTETVPKNELNTWQTLIGTRTVKYTSDVPNEWYPLFRDIRTLKPTGKVRLRKIKIEEGSTATPYQPNLLDDPYWLGKAPLGENIANKSVTFPIKSSAYSLYQANMEEEFVLGQTYTITMKATKPPIQTFIVYNEDSGDYRYGNLEPVEGLVDTWGLTFTPQKVGVNYPKRLTIIQYPQSTVGACRIDWLKIEKGDTRTPNISEYKYRGTGMRDSNNPKDYVWDLAPEYVEDNLATDIKISEITGKANNYTDGKVSEINSQLTASINEVDTTAKDAQTKANANATAIDELDNKIDERINDTATTTLTVTNGNTGSAKLYREGKTVSIYFVALNGKSSGGNDSTILTIPEGYRPPISFEQLVGSIDRSTLNSAQLSIGADGAIKWRRNSSYGSAYSFVITYSI